MPLFEDTPEERAFRTALRKFIANEMTPYREEWEKNRAVPREVWKKLGKQGFLCAWLPEEYGGSGVDFRYSVILGQELIRGDAMGIGAPNHQDVATHYVYSYASDELKKRLLPKCASGDAIGCICMTEPNAGSDAAAIRSKAVRKGDHYILNGQKVFITNGMFADFMVVMCRVESSDVDPKKNYSLLCVEGESLKHVQRRQLEKMGRHATDTAEVFFDDCPVPAGNLLGKEGEGFKYTMHNLARERLELCIKSQSYAEECFKEALKYAKEREAFGKPIGNIEAVSFMLAEMATEVEIGDAFLHVCVEEFLKGDDITKKVSMAKAWIAEMANRVAYKAVQIHGGYGYMAEYRICRLYQDVRVMPIFGGTTEIMNVVIARQLGLKPIF
ncbi:MAG: acyl-CoA dehydrogenase family protein [Spirochaetes bacterium]|nr:acyl-CoA dehydrogenase family protein [Spirochaetota bacterium]